jgi:hypothetical protein
MNDASATRKLANRYGIADFDGLVGVDCDACEERGA